MLWNEIQVSSTTISTGTSYGAPFDNSNLGEVIWIAPDTMTIKQIVVRPVSFGNGNAENTTNVFKFFVENEQGNMEVRASLTY